MVRLVPIFCSTLVVLSACPAPGTAGDGRGDGRSDDDDDDDDVTPAPAAFTYAQVDGRVCGNGTPTGLGLAPVDGGSDTLVIVMNGGGACWDNFSCFGLNAAAHIQTTYSADVLAADVAPLAATGLTDRADVDNPFRGADFAFVPYCTGDLGAGEVVRQYQADLLGLDIRSVHHMGRANMRAFLAVLGERFNTASTVYGHRRAAFRGRLGRKRPRPGHHPPLKT